MITYDYFGTPLDEGPCDYNPFLVPTPSEMIGDDFSWLKLPSKEVI